LQIDEQDEEPMILVNDNVDEDDDRVANELNCSMATCGSKSPERPMLSISPLHQVQDMKEALGNASAYAVLKPKFEQLCGALGKDPDLILKAQETLGELYSKAMAKNQKINTKMDGTYGMQSFPATDRATKYK
jgi:hypothetical protein